MNGEPEQDPEELEADEDAENEADEWGSVKFPDNLFYDPF